MTQTELTDFGTRYAAAWSSQNPVRLASFYNEQGSLTVNGGAPSVGRTAITGTARGFMTAFPDMVVKMDHVSQDGSRAVFRWTWTGTNTGPGGTGKSVRINGYEEWTMGTDGLIAGNLRRCPRLVGPARATIGSQTTAAQARQTGALSLSTRQFTTAANNPPEA
jgi:uncharacterized protein (TIGR02246 family)